MTIDPLTHLPNVKTAALIIGIQADFTEIRNGSLPVPGTGQSYLDALEEAARRLKREGFLIVAAKDDHPPDHISFFTRHPGKNAFDIITVNGHEQVLWPPHCVQGTTGSEILLNPTLLDAVVESATHPDYESYSAFQDDSGHPTELHPFLQEHNIARLVIFGIATDCWVKFTAIDGTRLGYTVVLIKDLCRGVSSDKSRAALPAMKQNGVKLLDDLDMKKLRSSRA